MNRTTPNPTLNPILNPKVNFNNLVKQLLPYFSRMPVRLGLLRSLISPLERLYSEFEQWRSDTRMLVNVTSQVAVLEGYLKKKYKEPVTIKIVTYDDGALQISFIEEGENHVLDTPLIDDTAEIEPPLPPLDGEIREQFGGVDFIVYVPKSIDLPSVRADISRFKQALIKYKINNA